MDFYGPRVPIGGGALSGKDFSHIDRAGAYAARHAALKAVVSGAKSCQVTLAYAPNCDLPMDVCYTMEGRGERLALEDFHHTRIRSLTRDFYGSGRLGSGCHFFAPELPWNRTSAACGTARKR
jgi:S-adenosylmethionine synthetase